jgi:hypothetical protein
LETVPLKFVGKFTKFDNLDSDSFAESSFTDYNPNHFGNDGGASITVSSKLNNMPPMNNNMDEGDPF